MPCRFPNHLKIATLSSTSDDRIESLDADRNPIFNLETQFTFFLSKALNFTFTFVVPDDMERGLPLRNGNWTGIFGLLQRGDADMSFILTGLFHERKKAVDFSYPYHISRVTFMTQKPQPLQKSLTIFNPFSGTVWITFILFILFFSVLLSIIHDKKRKFVGTFFSTFGSVLGQPFIKPTKHLFLFVGWLVAISFLMHCYKATLLSFLLVVPMKGISSIAELSTAVVDGVVKCRTFKGSYIINSLMESTDESHRIIGQSLLENSRQYSNPKSLKDPNIAQNTVFIAPRITLRGLENEFFISTESFFSQMLAIPVRKTFCCKKKLDRMLRKMVDTGLFLKMLKDIAARLNIIDEISKPAEAERNKWLDLEDLEGAFGILIFGHTLASLTLIAEILLHKMSRFFLVLKKANG